MFQRRREGAKARRFTDCQWVVAIPAEMSTRSVVRYFSGNAWMFAREKHRQRVAELRRAYGDLCWRCGGRLSFQPLATRRRATIEHLLSKKAGGTSAWENLRLCHPGCNGHLGTETPDQKRRMRTALARREVPDVAPRPKA